MNRPQDPTRALTTGEENVLDARLDALRSAVDSFSAPPALEARLMSAFKSHHATQRRRDVIAQWFAPAFALTASMGMAAWMVMTPMARPALDADADADARALWRALQSADAPFIALQSLEQIALEPRPRLIETAVPRMWLASYGMPVSPETASDSLRAEMVVSASGQPLAMRFMP